MDITYPVPWDASYRRDPDAQQTFDQTDSPLAFYRMLDHEQEVLADWCDQLVKIKTINQRHSSYGLKHIFSSNAFYVTNGEFKGAMLVAGFTPDDKTRTNWCFNVSERSIKGAIAYG